MISGLAIEPLEMANPRRFAGCEFSRKIGDPERSPKDNS